MILQSILPHLEELCITTITYNLILLKQHAKVDITITSISSQYSRVYCIGTSHQSIVTSGHLQYNQVIVPTHLWNVTPRFPQLVVLWHSNAIHVLFSAVDPKFLELLQHHKFYDGQQQGLLSLHLYIVNHNEKLVYNIHNITNTYMKAGI